MNIKIIFNFFNSSTSSRKTLFIIIIFLLGSCFIPLSLSNKLNKNYMMPSMMDEGNILFSPIWSTNTYLIDNTGTVNHSWPSDYLPGVAVWWLDEGTILRTIRDGLGPSFGGAGGGVQKMKWDGTIIWDFRYNTNGVLSHHDIKTLPNGNILLIAWETKTQAQAIAAGKNPNFVTPLGLSPDHIIEVQQTGPTSGTIVWEWHVWDHLIQDYDPSSDNYGVVKNHPELVDINYVHTPNADWMHTNSIDYNEELDQILISVRNFNEIWVIDHSTTTEEAAGHTGGNSGKGGDLLYRWGNPEAYRAGTINDRKFFLQHDAQWIKSGYPGEGNILVFNNGGGRPGPDYSSVEEIVTPIDSNNNYYLEPGEAYEPDSQNWIYTANPPTSFFAGGLSGAQRLSDGNTLICNGEKGKIFEVNPTGEIIWQYTNPYPNPLTNSIFKVVYVPLEEPPEPENPDLYCTGSLSWSDIKTGTTVSGSFQLENIGAPATLLNWKINVSSIDWGTWFFYPEYGKNLTPEDGQVTVHVSAVAPNKMNSDFEGLIRVENQDDPKDFNIIPVSLKTTVGPHSNRGMINLMWQKFYDLLQRGFLNFVFF